LRKLLGWPKNSRTVKNESKSYGLTSVGALSIPRISSKTPATQRIFSRTDRADHGVLNVVRHVLDF
jgi:hypothetical protein